MTTTEEEMGDASVFFFKCTGLGLTRTVQPIVRGCGQPQWRRGARRLH